MKQFLHELRLATTPLHAGIAITSATMILIASAGVLR